MDDWLPGWIVRWTEEEMNAPGDAVMPRQSIGSVCPEQTSV